MVHQFPHDGNLHLHVLLTDTSRGKKPNTRPASSTFRPVLLPSITSSSFVTFLAELAGEHAVTFACPSGHPGLVKDALLPGFDQLHQGQVGLDETSSLRTGDSREETARSSRDETLDSLCEELFS